MQISNEDIGIGILASEKSRRIKNNKAFLELNGQSFIERLCQEFGSFGNIYISSNNKETYKDFPYITVVDERSGVGPMEGIYQILKASEHKYNFICSVDMPYLKKDILEYLISKIDGSYDCYVFDDGERSHPTCCIYSKELTTLIEDLIANKKYCLLAIFDDCRTKYIDFPNDVLDYKMLTNINTQEDYDRLCQN